MTKYCFWCLLSILRMPLGFLAVVSLRFSSLCPSEAPREPHQTRAQFLQGHSQQRSEGRRAAARRPALTPGSLLSGSSSAILGRRAGLAGAAGRARPTDAELRPGSARPIHGRVPHAAAPHMPSVVAGAGRESVAARLTGQGRARRGGRPASAGRCLSAAAVGGRADSGGGDAARPPCLSLPAAGPSSAPSLAFPPPSPRLAPAPVSAGAPGGEKGPGAASRCPWPPPAAPSPCSPARRGEPSPGGCFRGRRRDKRRPSAPASDGGCCPRRGGLRLGQRQPPTPPRLRAASPARDDFEAPGGLDPLQVGAAPAAGRVPRDGRSGTVARGRAGPVPPANSGPVPRRQVRGRSRGRTARSGRAAHLRRPRSLRGCRVPSVPRSGRGERRDRHGSARRAAAIGSVVAISYRSRRGRCPGAPCVSGSRAGREERYRRPHRPSAPVVAGVGDIARSWAGAAELGAGICAVKPRALFGLTALRLRCESWSLLKLSQKESCAP